MTGEAITATPGAGWTELSETTSGPDVGSYRGLQTQWASAPDTTADITGMTVTAGAVRVAGIAVEVKALVVAPGGPATVVHLTTGGSGTDTTVYTTAAIAPSSHALVLAWVCSYIFGTVSTHAEAS